MVNRQVNLGDMAACEGLVDYKLNHKMETGKIFNKGDFSFHNDDKMLSDHYHVLCYLDLYDFFKKPWSSYMFNNSKELILFNKEKVLTDINGQPASIDDIYNHSGASFGYVCRQMQYIINNGWQAFVNSCLEYRLSLLEEYERIIVPGLKLINLL